MLVHKSPTCSTLSTTGILAILVCVVSYYVVLICISQMNNKVKDIFPYTYQPFGYSLLWNACPWLLAIFLLGCLSFSYWLAGIFKIYSGYESIARLSHSVACLFVFLMVPWLTKVLNSNVVQFINLVAKKYFPTTEVIKLFSYLYEQTFKWIFTVSPKLSIDLLINQN